MNPAAGEEPSPVIDCRNLRFTYRGADSPALRGVDLSVGANLLFGLAGPGGAGKSTLLRCMNRLVPEFHRGDLAGEIRIFGEPVAGRRVHEMARRVGMVFQDFEAQLFSTTVADEAVFGAARLGCDPAEVERRAARCLEWTGLDGYRDRDPARLSGGEKQKLAIASVLAMEPDLLLLDEPTTDLDPYGRRQVWELVRDLRRRGAAVMIAEHDAEELAGCDEMVVLSEGAAIGRGRPREILTRIAEMDRAGVAVPDLVRVAAQLGGGPMLPAGPGETAELLRRRGVAPGEAAWRGLLERDEARREGYGPELLRLEQVRFAYPDGREALRGVDFAIREGEFVALLGGNGSGKTTVAKHLNGLLRPSAGAVRWRREDIRRWAVSEMGRRVGFVFQNPDHQIFSATVRDEVAFACRNFGLPETEIGRRVEESLATVGLAGREQEDPFLLTKGERQRLAVASVLAVRPPVLVLDEPTTGLDQPAQIRMMDLLAGLNRRGHTIVIITHALALAARYAHRCLLLAGGRLRADGPAREVFADLTALGDSGLEPPAIVALGLEFGRAVLSVEEFLGCCGNGGI